MQFWQDWRFWQIVVTGGMALAGFTLGTWIKYYYDLRLEKKRREEETRALAAELHGDLFAILSRVRSGQSFVRQQVLTPGPLTKRALTNEYLAHLEVPRTPVFDRNVGRLGRLPATLAREIVEFYAFLEMINKRNEMDCILRDRPDEHIFEMLAKDWKHAEDYIVKKLDSPLASLAGVDPFGERGDGFKDGSAHMVEQACQDA